MFKDTKAFSGFSVNDIQRAKEFYGETLSLLETGSPLPFQGLGFGPSTKEPGRL